MRTFQSVFKSTLFRNALASYQRSLTNPLRVQEKLLEHILYHNRKTAYGFAHKFSTIKTIKQFQKQVPIITYEDITHYVACMLQGMNNVLTKDEVVFFATTSGSTNKPKLIPVTQVRTKQLHQELMLWAFFMIKHNLLKGVRGKMLYFAGPIEEDVSQAGITLGSISGYMASKTPVWAKNKLVIPPKTYNEMNFNKKTKCIALKALATKDITQIGFAAPIEAILFFDYLKKNKSLLLHELSKKKKLRARQLAHLQEFKPITIWPKLNLINCIKSATNTPYLKVVEEKIGKELPVRDPGIFASEGRLTLGLTKHDRAGVLVAQENFFEFMPIAKDGSYKAPVTIDNIKKNKQYKVIITTQEGLYRYDMGDVIEVIDFKGKLPIVRFITRDNFLNIVGEFCPENQLLQAMETIQKKLNVELNGFTFAPYTLNLQERPCYEVLIEPKNHLSEVQSKEFIKELDKELKKRVQDYRQMREEFGRLGHIRIAIVKKGSYEAFEKSRLTRAGQPKPIRIAKDASFRNKFKIEQEIIL